ncbi:MAG: response regulator [Acidobacteriaceae bacterium]|nr:response regulator [Acidobacteriaceae bacterium]
MKRQLLAVVEDLFFAVKIEAAARQAGWVVRFVKTAEAARAGAAGADLVVVDLNLKGVDVLGLLGELPGERVIGFVSHVQTELRRAAAEAGCGRVLARSVFSERLPAILQGAEDAEGGAGVEGGAGGGD